ncbi:hypothetical protein MC04F18_40940 [Escherichia coli]
MSAHQRILVGSFGFSQPQSLNVSFRSTERQTPHNIGTPRPELGEYIFALPVERHMIFFLQTDTEIIIIRILSQHQNAGRHINWQ